MGVELAPVKALLDHVHPALSTQRDQNSYVLGDMEGHNVAIAVLPDIGTNAAAMVATQLLNDFPSIRFGLLVGIGGGVPDDEMEEDGYDVRLGDVVVGKPTATFGGVVQYNFGKHASGRGFERTVMLNKPPMVLRSAVQGLLAQQAIEGSKMDQILHKMGEKHPLMKETFWHPGTKRDLLFRPSYQHPGGSTCNGCDQLNVVERHTRADDRPRVHYGTIGSANQVVKDVTVREELRRKHKIMCVEMEAAGLMDSFPCLVIRGICDYADSHKNKKWQPYAAATAAAYMKELLSAIPPQDVVKVVVASEAVKAPGE
jgi:nucleoside phosphorylase